MSITTMVLSAIIGILVYIINGLVTSHKKELNFYKKSIDGISIIADELSCKRVIATNNGYMKLTLKILNPSFNSTTKYYEVIEEMLDRQCKPKGVIGSRRDFEWYEDARNYILNKKY